MAPASGRVSVTVRTLPTTVEVTTFTLVQQTPGAARELALADLAVAVDDDGVRRPMSGVEGHGNHHRAQADLNRASARGGRWRRQAAAETLRVRLAREAWRMSMSVQVPRATRVGLGVGAVACFRRASRRTEHLGGETLSWTLA